MKPWRCVVKTMQLIDVGPCRFLHALLCLYAITSLCLFHGVGAKRVGSVGLDDCKAALEKARFQAAVELCQAAAEADDISKTQQLEALLRAAEALTALGKSLAALRQYNEVLDLDSSNQAGLLGKAESSLKLGDVGGCLRVASKLKDPEKRSFLVRKSRFFRSMHKALPKILNKKNLKAAIAIYEELLRFSPDCSFLLLDYANVYIQMGEYQRAIDIFKREAALAGDSSMSYYAMGKCLLALGNLDAAKKFINGAIRDNPDLPQAMALRSKIRQMEALIDEASNRMLIAEGIKKLEELLKAIEDPIDPGEKFYDPLFPHLLRSVFKASIVGALCPKYSRRREPTATTICREAMSLLSAESSQRKECHVALVEALLNNQEFEDASAEAKTLQGLYPHDSEISKLAQKVTESVKKSKIKDYYAILGVEKGATAKDIKKAYKKLSMKWHPDKHSMNPQPAEQKMRDINKAHEVLSHPEKRREYDLRGFDPDDPESAAHAGFGGGSGGGFHGGFGGFNGFPGFDFGGQNFEFVFRDGQGREWRQPGGGGQRHQQRHYYNPNQQYRHQHQQRQQQKQESRNNWRWEDL